MATQKKTTTKKKTRGIVLIALGHPYYGKYAANLALSLKHTAPEVKISIVHDDVSLSHFTYSDYNLFDKQIPCKNKWNMIHGVDQHIMAKLYLNEMTPYDETLYLDVDMVWHPKRSVEECMNSLSSLDFTMQNRGFSDLKTQGLNKASHWVDLEEVKAVYKVSEGKFWHLSSEFIWFKKTKAVNDMFSDAQKHYKSIKVAHTQFAGGIPDELCFALSMLRHNDVVPHRVSFTPIFWNQAETNARSIEPSAMYAGWYGYSMGGANNPPFAKKIYDNLIQYYAQHKGIQNPFKAKDKGSFLPDRVNT